ncbi:hypothetical protein HMPREF9607_00664 [Cutibacterium modestum HL044PA1]|uniref:Uncharacterized protein n=1 Tax=Cutibacterium modestum HL044PA1 TaxID=765109 RepID=A0ABP2KA97_9ACTN|nr:hypothetical protein HMPREF9607_00664 [Cutibacterium modestum HL044PA1]
MASPNFVRNADPNMIEAAIAALPTNKFIASHTGLNDHVDVSNITGDVSATILVATGAEDMMPPSTTPGLSLASFPTPTTSRRLPDMAPPWSVPPRSSRSSTCSLPSWNDHDYSNQGPPICPMPTHSLLTRNSSLRSISTNRYPPESMLKSSSQVADSLESVWGLCCAVAVTAILSSSAVMKTREAAGPRIPDIPGSDSPPGNIFHSAR